MKIEFDDFEKVVRLIITLKKHSKLDTLITSSVSVMKKEDSSWRQVSALVIEEAKSQDDK